MATKVQTPEQFFYKHAAWSYDPKTQSQKQGRLGCARKLAEAERRGSEVGLSFHWEVDPDIDSSDFTDEQPPWRLWQCLCRTQDGTPAASLSAIDFGPDGEPWGDAYRRVVEAELALQALGNLDM